MSAQPIPHRVAPASGSMLLGRRALPRVGVSLRARLHVHGLVAPLSATTRDVGLRGLCIATPTPFAHLDLHRITLYHAGATIEVRGEGRWQAEGGGRDAFLTGILLSDVNEGAHDALWDLVHERVKKLTRWLKQQPVLEVLEFADLVELAHAARIQQLRAGQVLYQQDGEAAAGRSLYLVTTGAIALERRTPRGRVAGVDEIGPGELFGGLGLVADLPPNEIALAAADSSLLEISPAAFEYLQRAAPGFAFRLGTVAVGTTVLRLRRTLAAIADR
jgi:Cyclic nucleotide-binding domain/PilZ domain